MKGSKVHRKSVSLILVLAMLVTLAPPPSPVSLAHASPPQGEDAQPAAAGMSSPTNEWVNFYSQNSTLNGQPLPTGAVVRAYNPRGVQCGEFVVTHPGWYGVMPVYRDDPETPEDEGMQPGETVSFTINGSPANAMGPDAATWTTNGALIQADVVAEGGLVPWSVYLPLILRGISPDLSGAPVPIATKPPQVAAVESAVMISLQSGWHLISFNVLPTDQNITSILAPIS